MKGFGLISIIISVAIIALIASGIFYKIQNIDESSPKSVNEANTIIDSAENAAKMLENRYK